MLIPAVEQGLERMLRAAIPIPDVVGDVSFDPPSRNWSAQLSRLTVNMFLFGIGRSPQPPRPTAERTNDAGRVERRAPLPMIQLNYLVSAWAGNVRDEHELLGDVLACFLTTQVLPAEYSPPDLPSSVQIALAPSDHVRAKDVLSGVDGTLRASFEIVLTTALDGIAWHEAAPSVQRIEALAAPIPRASANGSSTRQDSGQGTSRGVG
ncbi:MAG: hypothetical protein JWN95_2120 [Frankiales bacterium]|nr:hypothetical protein [Frankiales bacterium]